MPPAALAVRLLLLGAGAGVGVAEGAGLTLLRATGCVGSLTEGVAEAVAGLTADREKEKCKMNEERTKLKITCYGRLRGGGDGCSGAGGARGTHPQYLILA